MNVSPSVTPINQVDVFTKKLDELQKALEKGYLINDRLEVVKKEGFKWGIKWLFLSLLRPFYALCGKDAFSHLRVNNVVNKAFSEYFKTHQNLLTEDIVEGFKTNILNLLESKTKCKYKILEKERFEDFLPPPSIKWPNEVHKSGITKDQKTAIDHMFSEILPLFMGEKSGDYSLSFSKDGEKKRIIKLQNKSGMVKEFEVPLSFFIEERERRRASRIFVYTKNVIAKGGERKVRTCFELMSGEVFVRKKCVSNVERLVLNHFYKNPTKGIEPIECEVNVTREIFNVNGPIIEPYFSHTLYTFFDQNNNICFNDVYSIMHQLAIGLAALHDFTPRDTFCSSRIFNEWTTNTYLKTFHCDIKPGNILIRGTPGNWEAVLADFGLAGKAGFRRGTIGYLPPEDVKLRLKAGGKPWNDLDKETQDEIRNIALACSQKKDIWALGLVFVEMLANECVIVKIVQGADSEDNIKPVKKLAFIRIAPLSSLKRSFLAGKENKDFDRHIADLTQNELDSDIEEYRKMAPLEYQPLWNLVSQMLQVDFQQRITAEELKQKLESLKE